MRAGAAGAPIDFGSITASASRFLAGFRAGQPDPALGLAPPAGAPVTRGNWRHETLYNSADTGGATIFGFQGEDRLIGDSAANWLEGGAGDDFLDGGAGSDILWGGAGRDYIRSGQGADRIIFVHGDIGRPPNREGGSYEQDHVGDFDPAAGDVLEFYGFGDMTYELLPSLSTDGTRIRFEDGTIIELDYVPLSAIQDNPGCIVFPSGPPPVAEAPPPNAPFFVFEDTIVGFGSINIFTEGAGFVLGDFERPIGSLTNFGSIFVTSAAPERYAAIGVLQGNSGYDPTQFVNGISGVIRAENAGGAGAIGVAFTLDAPASHNLGVVEAISADGSAIGFSVADGAWRLDNDGRVSVRAGQTGIGVNIGVSTNTPWAAANALDNTGLIEVHAGAAIGVLAEQYAYLTNTGTILAVGEAIAFGVVLDMNGEFNNAGTIRAVATGPGGYSIGVTASSINDLWASSGGFQDYVNSGLIEADIAIWSDDVVVYSRERSIERVHNTGVIRGEVLLGLGWDEVRNSGLIDGNVDLGADTDIYDGSANGQVLGGVFGGEHDDRLIGGGYADYLFGDDGADALNGGGGDDFLDGGRGADLLDGGAGFDTVSYLSAGVGVTVNLMTGVGQGMGGTDTLTGFEGVQGGLYADTLRGSDAANVLEGNGGDDVILGGGGDDVIFGDRGADTLTGDGGHDIFVFNIGDGADIITDFKAGTLVDQIQVFGYSGYQSLQQIGADTRIVLSATDSILLRNVLATSLTAADFDFSAVPLAPAPSPSPQGSLLLNQLLDVGAGEVIDITRIVLHEYGEGPPPAAGVLMQTVGGMAPPALFNSGRISIAGGALDDVVYGVLGGEQNAFVNRAGGQLELTTGGTTDAVGVWGGLPVFNAGTVRVTAGGDATGVITQTAFVNTGELDVRAGGAALGVSLIVSREDFWNTGVITVAGTQASVGVYVNQRASIWETPAFVNSGTLRVTDATAALDSVALSIGVSPDTVFFNSGVIEGDYAIRSTPYTTGAENNLSTIINSGQLRGRVDLGVERSLFFNDGLITGRVDLGAADDDFDGRLGTQTGGVFGGDGADRILMGAGDNQLDGGAGADVLSGGAGGDRMTGGAGADIFYTGSGADEITDFRIADGDVIRVNGYAAWQSIQQQGADVLITFSATDSLLVRNIQLAQLTASQFQFSAAAIGETAGRRSAEALPSTPTVGSATPLGATLVGTELANTLTGGDLNDYLRGLAGADNLSGGDGRDMLEGGDGNDILAGGAGADTLDGGAGDDHLIGLDGDTLTGGAGADIFEFDVTQLSEAVITDFNVVEGDTIVLRGLTAGWSLQPWTNSIVIQHGGPVSSIFYGAAVSLAELDAAVVGYGTEEADVIGFTRGGTLFGLGGDDHLIGVLMAHDDRLDGGTGEDWLEGGGGDDHLTGSAGNDRLDGGSDLDFAIYSGVRAAYAISTDAAGVTTVSGPDGVDTLVDVEFLTFADGHFTIDGTPTANLIRGGVYRDTLNGTSGADLIIGGAGQDFLNGGDGDDVIHGGVGFDFIDPGDGADQVFGGQGYDTLIAREGGAAKLWDGEYDLDIFDISSAIGDLIFDGTVSTLRFTVGNHTVLNVETIISGSGDDRFDFSGETFWELTIRAGGGDDEMTGGAGADELYGGGGSDLFHLFADDFASGGDGDDTFIVTDGPTLHSFTPYIKAWGGDGYDTLVLTGLKADANLGTTYGHDGQSMLYIESLEAVVVNGLAGGEYAVIGDRFANCFSVAASHDDGSFGVTFEGWGGDDLLLGGMGADILSGQTGDDSVRGGGGDDLIDGGSGADVAVFSGDRSLYTISTVGGVTTVVGPDGTDTLRNVEHLVFANGAFDLAGARVVNRVAATAGADTLIGTTAEDTFNAGAGDDVITGSLGNDRIDGGAGHDVLIVSGAFSDYRLLMNGDDFVLKGPDGGDYLTGVETIRFGDGRVLELNRMYGPDVDSAAWADGKIPESLLSGGSTGGGQPQVLPPLENPAVWGQEGDDGPQVLPGEFDPAPEARHHDVPQVLPGSFDPAPEAEVEGDDGPQVLPGVGETRAYVGLEARFGHDGDWMPTLAGPGHLGAPDGGPLVPPGPAGLKAGDEPQVLPGAEETPPLFADRESHPPSAGDWMLTLDPNGGAVADPTLRHDDWM